MGEPALTLDLGPETTAPVPEAPTGPRPDCTAAGPGTGAVLEALCRHYRKPGSPRDGEILIPEAEAPGTGRRCDLIRVSMWRSRGQGIDGHEIKVSRSDWLRELDDPAKADAWWPHCSRWWIVTPPGLVRQGELPEGWGLLEVPSRGRRFKVRVEAASKEPKLTVALLGELLRRADNARLNELERDRRRWKEETWKLEERIRGEAGEAALPYDQRIRLDLLGQVEEAIGCRLNQFALGGGRRIDTLTPAELAAALKDAADTTALVRRAAINDHSARTLRRAATEILRRLDAEERASDG